MEVKNRDWEVQHFKRSGTHRVEDIEVSADDNAAASQRNTIQGTQAGKVDSLHDVVGDFQSLSYQALGT